LTTVDNFFMNKAINLAKKGLGKTHPNPCVGSVLVANEKIIGQGFHIKAGCDHAEIFALKEAGSKSKNSTLYITLEPCSHEGRTPPCVDSIIKAGVARVVIGSKDPNPMVNGEGIKQLRAAGINVEVNFMQEQCEKLNPGFYKRMLERRPYVRSKIACSFDGKTSLNNRESKWISSEASRNDVQKWRQISAAVLTGVSTINADDPQLNVRQSGIDTQPIRIILDTHLSVNINAKILNQSNIIIFHHDDPRGIKNLLEDKKIKLIRTKIKNGLIDLKVLLEQLGDMEINDILVESGPTLNGELLKAQLIDELIIYQAPILLAGDANSLFNQPVLQSMKDRIYLEHSDIRNFAGDIRYLSKVHYSHVD